MCIYKSKCTLHFQCYVRSSLGTCTVEGTVKNHDKWLLVSNRGHVMLTRNLDKCLLCSMGLLNIKKVQQPKNVTNFEELKEQN